MLAKATARARGGRGGHERGSPCVCHPQPHSSLRAVCLRRRCVAGREEILGYIGTRTPKKINTIASSSPPSSITTTATMAAMIIARERNGQDTGGTCDPPDRPSSLVAFESSSVLHPDRVRSKPGHSRQREPRGLESHRETDDATAPLKQEPQDDDRSIPARGNE